MYGKYPERAVRSAKKKTDKMPRNRPGARNRPQKHRNRLVEIPVSRWDKQPVMPQKGRDGSGRVRLSAWGTLGLSNLIPRGGTFDYR
jgi:hypothetical protein